MAIVVAGGFKVNNNESVDNRIVLTKTQMKTFNDVNLPDVYFAICKGETDDDTDPDIGKMFLYNKNNDVDEKLGKFRSLDSKVELKAEYHENIKELELLGFNT